MSSSSSQIAAALEKRVREEIPVTRHLRFRIRLDAEGLPVLDVPLKPNINHLGTAFGGSLNMLCTIGGWCGISLLLKDLGIEADIIIQKNEMSFVAQTTDDFYVNTERPDPEKMDSFAATFNRFGRARLSIVCHVMEKHLKINSANYRGVYAAIRKDRTSA